jgi:hypothetical protein
MTAVFEKRNLDLLSRIIYRLSKASVDGDSWDDWMNNQELEPGVSSREWLLNEDGQRRNSKSLGTCSGHVCRRRNDLLHSRQDVSTIFF